MASQGLANAYINIIPSMEGVGSSITSTLSREGANAGCIAGEESGNAWSNKLKSIIAGAGIGLAVKKAFDAINSVANAGDELDKLSQKMGITSKELQGLQFAGEHCSISTSTFQMAVKKLQSQNYKGTLTDFLDGLMNIEDATKRTSKAHEVLGDRVANEMAAYINGDKSISDYTNDLEALGGLMSSDSVKASAMYADSMTDMQTAMNGVKTSLVEDFLPSCSTVMSGVAEIISGDSTGFGKIMSGVEDFAKEILDRVLNTIYDLIGLFYNELPEMVETGKDTLMGIIKGITDNIPEWLDTASDLIEALLDSILMSLPDILDAGVSILLSIVNGIINNLPKIAESIVKLCGKILTTIVQNLPYFIEKGSEIVTKLAVGMINAIPKIVEALPKVFDTILKYAKKVDWVQVGKDVINGIVKGIKSLSNAIWDALKKICSDAFKNVKNFFGIKSPSRLFKNQIGKNITLGLSDGITSEVDSVYEAMGELQNATLDGFSTDGQLEVMTNASSMNYMIEALNKLVNKSEYIVLDTGELIGGISDKMNSALYGLQLKGARGL